MTRWFIIFFASAFCGWGIADDFKAKNRPFDVKTYRLRLSLDPEQDPNQFDASVEISLKLTEPTDRITLDLDELKIKHVRLLTKSTEALQFQQNTSQVEISLPSQIKRDAFLTLDIEYAGKIQTSHRGFFKVTDPDNAQRGNLYFTHFEALSARAFFPCNDEPYDKAQTEIMVRLPDPYIAISNGKLVSSHSTAVGSKKWKDFVWKMSKPHSTYLVSLAVGKFDVLKSKLSRVPIEMWTAKEKLEKARFALKATEHSMKFLEGYLSTKYAWPRYATTGLPTFLWGGMENTSSTHMNQDRMLINDPRSSFEKKRVYGLVAHELAHQWFGDLVTMKWWDDLWLNEAFASYFGTLSTKAFFKNEEADVEALLDLWEDYFRQEDGPRSHPIVISKMTSPDDAFDSISYTKGENVLKMLSYYMGEKAFKKGVALYLKTFAEKNASYLDFFTSLEKASDLDLKPFRDSWLLNPGYPVLSHQTAWSGESKKLSLTVKQRHNQEGNKTLFYFKLPVAFHRRSTPEFHVTQDLLVTSEEAKVEVSLPAEPEWITLNPDAKVLAKIDSTGLTEKSLMAQSIGDPNLFSRIWSTYELARPLLDGKELTPEREEAIVNFLRQETSPYARVAMLSGLQKAKTRTLTEKLGIEILKLSRSALAPEFETSSEFKKDSHGWSQWRSELLGTLGKIKSPEVLPLLALVLSRSELGLDDLMRASYAIASTGDDKAVAILNEAIKLHKGRGYRFYYSIAYAFSSFESPKAANELKNLIPQFNSDFVGRIGWTVRENETLRNSPEWADFLREFISTDARFGDEVKSRILQTVEDLKTAPVKKLLNDITTQSSSLRIQEQAKKILEKNFS